MKTHTRQQTAHVRVSKDLVAMISAILLSDSSLRSSEILDPLLRPELERRYAALPAHVRQTVEGRARKATKPAKAAE